VIIISTVRTSTDYFEYDQRYSLGIIAQEKRFNVALTRAQALLIVVGDGKTLAHDRHWNALLKYCCDNNAYRGTPLPNPLPNPLPMPIPHVNDDDDDDNIQLVIDPNPGMIF
jgi:helicase MOV-10